MKSNNHVSPKGQAVQIGDMGGDEYDSMVCTGYYVSDRPGPGFPYVSREVWWSPQKEKWEMCHPTENGESIEVPASMTIYPRYEIPA